MDVHKILLVIGMDQYGLIWCAWVIYMVYLYGVLLQSHFRTSGIDAGNETVGHVV